MTTQYDAVTNCAIIYLYFQNLACTTYSVDEIHDRYYPNYKFTLILSSQSNTNLGLGSLVETNYTEETITNSHQYLKPNVESSKTIPSPDAPLSNYAFSNSQQYPERQRNKLV